MAHIYCSVQSLSFGTVAGMNVGGSRGCMLQRTRSFFSHLFFTNRGNKMTMNEWQSFTKAQKSSSVTFVSLN